MAALISIQKVKQYTAQINEAGTDTDSLGWFGNQGERLRLEQGVVGVKGCLMEGGRRGEHGGVQGGEGDWPSEDRCGWLAA